VITSISQWVQFLASLEPLVGLPFCIGGLVLMIIGWRLWKACTVLTFALIGLALGTMMGASGPDQIWYALGGALLLGIGSFPPVNYSVALLGGLIGGGILYGALESLGLSGPALWIAAGLACAAVTGISAINLRHVIIFITAFEGAALLVSGLAVFVLHSSNLIHHFRGMAYTSGIFLPFILLVPTVVGAMVQMADVRQRDSGMAKG